MKAWHAAAACLLTLAFAACTLAVLAYTGILALGPNEAELESLKARYSILLERAVSAPNPQGSSALLLANRWTDLRAKYNHNGQPIGADQLIEFLSELDRVLTQEGAAGAVMALMISVKILEETSAHDRAAEIVSASRRPLPIDLARVLLRDAIAFAEEAINSSDFQFNSSARLAETDADVFLQFVKKRAAVNYAETVWSARHDIELLTSLPIPNPPGNLALYLSSITRNPSAWADEMHALLASPSAKLARSWQNFLSRWDAAVIFSATAD